jgi:hypothetical protein
MTALRLIENLEHRFEVIVFVQPYADRGCEQIQARRQRIRKRLWDFRRHWASNLHNEPVSVGNLARGWLRQTPGLADKPLHGRLPDDELRACSGEGSIAEIARGGGCLQVNPSSLDEIEAGSERLATDASRYSELGRDAQDEKLEGVRGGDRRGTCRMLGKARATRSAGKPGRVAASVIFVRQVPADASESAFAGVRRGSAPTALSRLRTPPWREARGGSR